MVVETKSNAPSAMGSSAPATAVVGATSLLEPGTGLAVTFDPDAGVQMVQEVDGLGRTPGAKFAQSIARASQDRAERFGNSPRAWVSAGFAALAASEFENARQFFERALSVIPTDNQAILGLARVAHEQGDIAQAERLLKAVTERDPANIEARVSLAVVRVSDGRPDDALAALPTEVPPTIANASVFAVRGSVLLSLGDAKGAVSNLRKAARLRPEWVQVRNTLALSEQALGHKRSAERHFREALRVAPIYLEPLLNLARMFRSERRWSELLEVVGKHWSPGTAPLEMVLIVSEAAIEVNDPRTARLWLEPALSLGAAREVLAPLINNLGVAHARMGQWTEAAEAFAKSADMLPGAIAVANVGKALLELGRPEDACAWLLQHRELLDAGDPDALVTLGVALLRSNKPEQAEAVVRVALQADTAHEDSYSMLSAILTDHLDRAAEAVEVARMGFARNPGSPQMVNSLAYALLQAGEVDEAETVLDAISVEAVEQPRRVYLVATRGLLELHRGRLAEGRALYDRAASLAGSEGLRERVRVKRDLETARALLRLGRPASESLRFLQRASEGTKVSEPYSSQARELLKALSGPHERKRLE